MSGYGFDVGTSGYDDEDRLVSWQRDDNNLDQAWNLSLVGDWDSYTENASVQSRTHGPTHELLTAAGQALTHDAKGNQTSIPAILRISSSDPLSMKWDFENKLISADIDNDSVVDVTYQWDALGRRVARTTYFPLPLGEGQGEGSETTVYVQSGQQTIADYTSGTSAASPTYTYVYASYIDEPVMRAGTGGNRYYHRNQQYSVIAMSNGGGTITERYAYSAYGTPTITDASGTALTTSADNNRYTYTGREFDEALSLYHYRARMYDSASGRFCSRDPIGYYDGYNAYRAYFVGADTDPLGLSFQIDLVHMTVEEIRAQETKLDPIEGPHVLGTTTAQPVQIQSPKFMSYKKGRCCFCTKVWKPVKLGVIGKSYLPWEKGIYMTDRGRNDVVRHEAKRISVFRLGYEAYLKPVEAASTRCPVICGPNLSELQSSLKDYLNDLRNNAKQQYFSYIVREQWGINTENDHRRTVYESIGPGVFNERFDGYYKHYKINKPYWSLNVPTCPTGPGCSLSWTYLE
jgi:RHS repeat-associated protein